MTSELRLCLVALSLCACTSDRAAGPNAGNKTPDKAANKTAAVADVEINPTAKTPEKAAWMKPTTPLQINTLPYKVDARQVQAADKRLASSKPADALAQLANAPKESDAGLLVKARALVASDNPAEALSALKKIKDPVLKPFVALEQGIIAVAQERWAEAISLLDALATASPAIKRRATLPLAQALATHNPEGLIKRAAQLEKSLPNDKDARSLMLGYVASAFKSTNKGVEALKWDKKRFIEEPVAPSTPESLAAGESLSLQDKLQRLQALLDSHRNERVIEEAAHIDSSKLNTTEHCRYRFIRGYAHRKLHNYKSAEDDLMWVTQTCEDQDLARRALYLGAKVISIRAGLRAIAPINDFAKRFADHSMTDDVLFWGGDLYQRRNRWKEAEAFYRRIETMKTKGDHCADSRWRMAWISYRQDNLDEAVKRLNRILLNDGCADDNFEKARAHYWLGLIAHQRKDDKTAQTQWEKTLDVAAVGFYGQLALNRLIELDPKQKKALDARLAAPKGEGLPAPCPGYLAADPAFDRAIQLLVRGLGTDAATELRSVAAPEKKVVSKSHAVSQAVEVQEVAPETKKAASATKSVCGEKDASLLIALLLDRAGANRDAHWRLRTEFSQLLERFPTKAEVGIFRAAYPLAYRDELGFAEKESNLPDMLLQALSREESAFDPEIVSWAGAYGLTQLLLTTAQRAGKMLKPSVTVTTTEQLLEPKLNARLGGAFMASMMKKYNQYPALCLVGYNASEKFARTLWNRHIDHDFDRFAEEISIRETRGYVKRVLKTYGIYRWLYGDEAPYLPIPMRLPPVK